MRIKLKKNKQMREKDWERENNKLNKNKTLLLITKILMAIVPNIQPWSKNLRELE